MPVRASFIIPIQRPLARPMACVAGLCLALMSMLAGPAQATVYNSQNPNNPSNQANPWSQDIATQVGIIERVNSPVPMDLMLVDEEGQAVAFADFFKPGRPVVLNLGYSRCPSICILMREQITDVLAETGLKLGQEFVILNISIDPSETPEAARTVRDGVWAALEEKGMEPSPEGWRFLTADEATIQKLTEALGYRYLYIAPQNEFGHPGVLVLADGAGVIRRYMDGKNYDARTLRMSIVETSQGKAGGFLDKAFLTCFVWNPEANNYAATAKFIMMVGGGVTMVLVGGLVLAGLAYEKRRRQVVEQGGPRVPGLSQPNPA